MAMMGIAPAPAHESEAMSPATDGPSRADAPRVRGLLRRMMPRGHYSPLGAEQGTAPPPPRTPEMPLAASGYDEKPRRGWLRRLVPQEGVQQQQRRRWKNLGGAGASRRLAALSRSLRWKRLSSGLSVNLRGSWASALIDTVAFRVMYGVEAVVLGLALSCFFCCCGCKI